MRAISYKRHRFPPEVIRQAVWLYFKFTLSLRDVEEALAERGIDVSYETVRCWAEKFGRSIAANIRRSRPRPGSVWHLDVMVARIIGRRMFMWRAVDQEGEVLDVLVQKRRNRRAALKLLRKLLRKHDYWRLRASFSSSQRPITRERSIAAPSIQATRPSSSIS